MPPSGSAPSTWERSKLPQFGQQPVTRNVITALVCVPHTTQAVRTTWGSTCRGSAAWSTSEAEVNQSHGSSLLE